MKMNYLIFIRILGNLLTYTLNIKIPTETGNGVGKCFNMKISRFTISLS